MSSREAFEAWVTNEGKFPFVAERSGDSYKFLSTQNKWEVWQAATNEAEAKLTALTSQLESVVAENAALNEKMNKLATWPGIEFYSSAWEFNGCDGNDALEFMCDVQTPATSAFLAEVRASGVEKLREHPAIKLCSLTHVCDEFAAQLRQGGAV